MKKVKKLLSLLLTFVMTLTVLCGMFAGTKIEASAVSSSKTLSDALAWCDSKVGTFVDYDGAYGAQCVDLISAYLSYLGIPRLSCSITGGAKDYASVSYDTNYLTRIQGTTPQPGDIIIWTTGTYGHVAICKSSTQAYHQNWSGKNSAGVNDSPVLVNNYVTNLSSNGSKPCWGVLRPNFKSSSTQNPIVGTPTITSDKTLYEYGETVVLKRNTVQNTNYYWIVLWRGDKQVLSQKFENSTLSLSNLTEGKYRAYLQVGNSTSGTVTSEPFIFHVQGRITDSPQITSNKSDYFYGEDVTLIRNTVQSTNFYWIVLYRNGEMIASQAMDDEKMTMSNLEAGSYRLYLQVGNSISGTITSEPYFFTVNGDGWYKSNNKWMYYKNGDLQTGWSLISGKWYYFNSSGIMQTGWLQLGGKWYYLNSSGAMVTGWGSIDGKWYYFNNSGAMQTGWLQLGGKWYYLNSSGAMVTGWGFIGGKWYYFNNSGAMLTGWQQIGGKWYYFNSSGAMATGWIKLSGKWYYLNSSGAMITGTQKISGKTYRFNSSGVWIA